MSAGTLRRKFGPRIVGTYPRPAVAGELPDVEVTAGVKAVRPAANGTIDIDVAFTLPPFDPTAVNPLAELHAIVYGPGHGVHTDPDLAVASTNPMASTTETGSSNGGEVVVTIASAPVGLLKIVTVLSYQIQAPADPAPADPAPADPAPADPAPVS